MNDYSETINQCVRTACDTRERHTALRATREWHVTSRATKKQRVDDTKATRANDAHKLHAWHTRLTSYTKQVLNLSILVGIHHFSMYL